jgi:16S rRNA (guanine(1405)-N(7))-methyltransferase
MKSGSFNFDQMISSLKASRKYRSLDLPQEFLLDILETESKIHSDSRTLEHVFRRKVHEVVAPYLEKINYPSEEARLTQVFKSGDPSQVSAFCLDLLAKHSSTRERIPYLLEIYTALFDVTGMPGRILDLACGLHPFGLPWMGLDKNVSYHAFDIHKPRIDLINQFLSLSGNVSLAEQQDILVSPPLIPADVAFLFKEAHRIEKRKPGATNYLLQSINSTWVIISLPVTDLKGHHDLSVKHRQLLTGLLPGKYGLVHELIVGGELFFFLAKK